MVAGAKLLELFGDAATELCVRTDGDEGLFAGYSSVEFVDPVASGDFLEITAEVTRMGETSREMSFTAVRYARSSPEISDSAASIVSPPETVARAIGTCVVKKDRQRGPTG